MPIYEYHCEICCRRVEVWLRSGDDPALCPECGAALQNKLRSAPNILSAASRRPPVGTCCGREERCDSPACRSEDCCHEMGCNQP